MTTAQSRQGPSKEQKRASVKNVSLGVSNTHEVLDEV